MNPKETQSFGLSTGEKKNAESSPEDGVESKNWRCSATNESVGTFAAYPLLSCKYFFRIFFFWFSLVLPYVQKSSLFQFILYRNAYRRARTYIGKQMGKENPNTFRDTAHNLAHSPRTHVWQPSWTHFPLCLTWFTSVCTLLPSNIMKLERKGGRLLFINSGSRTLLVTTVYSTNSCTLMGASPRFTIQYTLFLFRFFFGFSSSYSVVSTVWGALELDTHSSCNTNNAYVQFYRRT